jgi:hypothetical protein
LTLLSEKNPLPNWKPRQQPPAFEMIAMDDIRQQLIELSLKLDVVVERL